MANWLLRHFKPIAGPATGPDDRHFADYDGIASREDIFRCFRLLLGRNPNAEEWPGHSGRAGHPLPEVVSAYLNSLEFTRRGLLDRASSKVQLVQFSDHRMYVDPDDIAVGHHIQAGVFEPHVTAVFRRELRPGMGVLDIGANIGYYTMLAAALVGPAGWVGAVEPNPSNVRLIETSRRANGYDHVTVMQVAAGRQLGLLALNTSHSNGTSSALPDDADAVLGVQTVPCVPPDRLVPPQQRIDFLKVDVEGAEYNALLGCQELITRWNPLIVSEFAPGMIRGISGVSGSEYLDWLADHHYGLQVICPDGSLSDRMDTDRILEAYVESGVDHIDILAYPSQV